MEFIFEDNNSQGFNNSGSGAHSMQMAADDIFTHAQTAPAVVQSGSTSPSTPRRSRRNLPGSMDEIEITGARKKPRARKTKGASKVNYVKTPRKKAKTAASFTWTWHKFWWMVALFAFMRLLLMDNGVIDYYKSENTIANNFNKLAMVQEENASLVSEIHKIQNSPRYQKKLARKHLGVIAKDEYLILFSQDSSADLIPDSI